MHRLLSQWNAGVERVKTRDEPRKEVSQVVEFTVLLILNIDDPPSVLSTSDGFAIDNDVTL